MMPGRLNLFQRTMLLWNDLHPYNSVHVVQIPAPFDAAQLRSAILATLKATGLGQLTLSADRKTFSFDAAVADCELKLIATAPDLRAAVEAEIEAQLNRPFESNATFSPVRFFTAPAEGSFYFGLVYFHPAADGESATALLKSIVDAYLGDAPEPQRLELYPPRHDRLVQQPPSLLLKKIAALVRKARLMRRSRRARSQKEADLQNRFTCVPLEAKDLEALLRIAKIWKVTVNDLFLALLLKSVLPGQARHVQSKKRHLISVGCIANLRKDLGLDARTFGLFLGSFSVSLPLREKISFRELAEEIRDQTARLKEDRIYTGIPLDVAFAGWMLKSMRPELRAGFYQKNHPLWGGVTNMNLNTLWDRRTKTVGFDYFRGVSTGPATPLVFSVTTFGKTASIGISYRPTILLKREIEQVKHCILETVRELQAQS